MTDIKITHPLFPGPSLPADRIRFEPSNPATTSPATLFHIKNDTTAPVILLDDHGRVLAKCPQCERVYHLIEHGGSTDEFIKSLALASLEQAKKYIAQLARLHQTGESDIISHHPYQAIEKE